MRDQLARIEGMVAGLFALGRVEKAGVVMNRGDAERLLAKMTTKQHAVAQMMIEGYVDRVIGERMGITRNTVKLHRAAINQKADASTIAEAVTKLRAAIDAVPETEYRRLSGGLPKAWAKELRGEDPYAQLYVKR